MIKMPLEMNYQTFLSIEQTYFKLLDIMQPEQSGLFRFLRRNGADATKLMVLGASREYVRMAYNASWQDTRSLALRLKYRSNRLSNDLFEQYDKIFWKVEVPKTPSEMLQQYYEDNIPLKYNLRRLEG